MREVRKRGIGVLGRLGTGDRGIMGVRDGGIGLWGR